ncbi:23S rRNA pseudouridylate synthase B [Snodgrassella communis]|uniref:Pseudouridine synthase n=1 Tax=Snodgrassella communis TaxID=2946699 RepID=A0A066TNX9_9NEIS|nr:pseudouridine synthase [Snodgrassella communis]KDN12903.1 Ribosomal large subunit pseudouridine synthase B [Snodgrassella communis]KDN15212.1 Ribosomal large subunit pseudouridine synthase B [Snodgrassella communis]PIT10356.1 23S rRNA pseudouridylate synthase B [Snodgrassella communis]PIT26830.1 23S rRNA pseudouridylate synthase B [Snodgrassella communis]PIT29751.1 23S rRNA pseudouridylate synthase B [Snodgrassella communis]
MSQANRKLTKRQIRDGVTSKSSKRTVGKHIAGKVKSAFKQQKETTRQSLSSQPETKVAAKVKVQRARKLIQRTPNQEILQRARVLKKQRINLEKMEPVRLQKALAASGVGSRREMEQWISQGLVRINGKVAQLGDRITPNDEISVRGSAINIKWPDRLPRIMVYYKQEGEIVSRDDPQGRTSIFDRLPQTVSSRWVAIGRLDINTCGLLILTTSGELVNRFAHPSFEVEREYAVRVLGELSIEQKQKLLDGVELEDGNAKIQYLSEQGGEGANRWYKIVIKEGRNREVRRLFESLGLTVSRLVRVRFGPIALPKRLKRGQYYEFNEFEVANIMKWAGLYHSDLVGKR